MSSSSTDRKWHNETIVNDAHKASDEIVAFLTDLHHILHARNIKSDPMVNDVDAPPVPTARPPETRFAERPTFRRFFWGQNFLCDARLSKLIQSPPPPKLSRWGVPIMEKLVPWDPLAEVARSKPMFFKCPSKEPCVLYKTTVPDHLRGKMAQQPPGKKNIAKAFSY